MKNAAEALFSYISDSKAEFSVIPVQTRILLWVVSRCQGQYWAKIRRQYNKNWCLFTAKFWSLTFSPSQILVTDVYSQPNYGHTDVFWATCITRIFALKANLKLEKTSAAFFTPFPMLRGVKSLIYQIFSDHGWVPLTVYFIDIKILSNYKMLNIWRFLLLVGDTNIWGNTRVTRHCQVQRPSQWDPMLGQLLPLFHLQSMDLHRLVLIIRLFF